jgi:hypothetical protein
MNLGREYGDIYEDTYDDQKELGDEMRKSCLIFLGVFFLVLAVLVICYLKTR